MRPFYDSDAVFWFALLLFAFSLAASAFDWKVVDHLTVGSTCRVVAGAITLLRTWRREKKQEHGKDPNRD